MKIKHFIFAIFITAAAVVGAFEVIRSKADPSLKEYKNDEIGYSFEYPVTCTLGPLPGECKQNPPEEMPQNCLCFLNAEDPNNVFLQSYQTNDGNTLSLSSLQIVHYDSPAFNPPEGAELIPWIKENFSEIYINIPEKINFTLGGEPAVAIKMPPTQSTYSYQDIFYIKGNKLFMVTLLNPTNISSQALYDRILSTFSWED